MIIDRCTRWKGEIVSEMSDQRATEARKEILQWADNYANVSGSVELGRQAKEFIKTFEMARK